MSIVVRDQYRFVLTLLLLIGTPCVAHLPELVGWKSCNPYFMLAGLTEWAGWVGGTCVVDGNVGATVQALGGLSAEQWLHGQLPWWDFYAGAGLPLASAMQPGSFFLPFVLLLHFLDGPLYLKLTMQILSGLFTFAFLREIGLRRGAAVVGGILFSLNGSFAYFGDAPVFPIPFLPLLLLGIERCRHRHAAMRLQGPLLVALAIGFSLVAGFPETALVDGLFGLAWLIVRVRASGQGFSSRMRFALTVCAGGVVGLLLATPVLIPFLRELPTSSLGPHSSVLSSLFRRDQLAGLLFPSLFGAPFEDFDIDAWGGIWGYFGAVGAMLALIACLSRWRDPRRLLPACWVLFFLLAACGVPGLMTLRQHLPLLDLVDFRRYTAASCEFAVVLLAAIALDDWQQGRLGNAGRRAILGGLLGFFVLAAVFLAFASHRLAAAAHSFPSLRTHHVVTVLFGLALTAATAWTLSRPPGRRSLLAMVVFALLDGLVAFMTPVLHGSLSGPPDLAPIAYLREHQGLSRMHSLGSRLVPNYAGYFGIASIDDMFCPVPLTWDRHVADLDPTQSGFRFYGGLDPDARNLLSHRSMFETYGVRYVLVPADHDPLTMQSGFRRVFDGTRSRIYELPAARPYFEVSSGTCTLTVTDRDHLAATCDGPAQLTRREMVFPGWQARVNGHKVAIGTEPPTFQTIMLPAGRSEIVWRYLPVDATAIAMSFGGGVLALMMLLAAAAWPVQAAGLRRRSANCLRNFVTFGAITTRQ